MKIEELTRYNETEFRELCSLVQTLSKRKQLTKADLDAVLQSPGSHLFVFRDEEGIKGMCTVGIYASPTGRKACLEDVVVCPTAQGQGIGRRLVEHAMDFLQRQSVRQLLFTSRPSRIAANALYRSMGFVQKETNVYVYEGFQ